MYTPDPERKLGMTVAEQKKYDKEQRQFALREIIETIMTSPIRKGEVIRLSKENPIPLKDLKGANVEMQVAMCLSIASEAAGGDIKAADWLCKYAGLEPAKETKVEVESVTFIDDIPKADAVAAAITKAVEDA